MRLIIKNQQSLNNDIITSRPFNFHITISVLNS